MNNVSNFYGPQDQLQFTTLKSSIAQSRKEALKKRLETDPFMTDMEYFLGAFLEMYEPYLREVVIKLYDRGYTINTTSGFGSDGREYQSLEGHFSIDYVTKNKLEKMGVKMRENNGNNFLIFLADKLDLDYIKGKWLQIIRLLPERKVQISPSNSPQAISFRRKYATRNPIFQKQKQFEKLEFSIQATMKNDITKRKTGNPTPDNIESRLGIFIEQLEPQVRQAVIEMNKKGYSTDVSGFMENSCVQIIEGDFQLDSQPIEKLRALDVLVETNPSGYTRLKFVPKDVNLRKIKKQWDRIVSLLPDKNVPADASMTRRAREFRVSF